MSSPRHQSALNPGLSAFCLILTTAASAAFQCATLQGMTPTSDPDLDDQPLNRLLYLDTGEHVGRPGQWLQNGRGTCDLPPDNKSGLRSRLKDRRGIALPTLICKGLETGLKGV